VFTIKSDVACRAIPPATSRAAKLFTITSRDAAAVAATPQNGNAKFILFCDARRDTGFSQGNRRRDWHFKGMVKIFYFTFLAFRIPHEILSMAVVL